MSFRFDSYCGLYCGACFVLTAYKQNRPECLPDKWVNPIHDKEIKCYGCKTEIVFENCKGCNIRNCAQKKNIEFCYECPENPCENIERFKESKLAHANVAIHYLKTIQEKGVQEWLQEQKERWLCKNCGSRFSWYEENCVQCGKELLNAIKEEKELKL